MKRKKQFAVMMICVVTMGLAACGGENNAPMTLDPIPIETENQNNTNVQAGGETQTQAPASDQQQTVAEAGTQQSDSGQQEQSWQISWDTELDKQLADFRAEREGMTNVALGNGVSGYGSPNAENYGLSDVQGYAANFDARELNEALQTAVNYVEGTLGIKVETNATVYTCIDPRITEIYDVEDKGVAAGYSSDNIFICEYCDNGNWQYLILVREAKGEAWTVIHHGSSYRNSGG